MFLNRDISHIMLTIVKYLCFYEKNIYISIHIIILFASGDLNVVYVNVGCVRSTTKHRRSHR